MIRGFKILLLLFVLSINSFAQKESNIWYFGQNAGIDFNNNTRVALTDGQMNAFEGCASVADSNGNLLFYSDGLKIWNRNHTTMFNGGSLMSGPSSSEAALIVKKPGSNNLFYVFTTDDFSGPNGLRYSIVDMNLASGLGGVTSSKNILITGPVEEKVIAVKHYNNQDFWIISHRDTSNQYLAYLLTPAGLNTNPVVSSIGLNVPIDTIPPLDSGIGHMKASPDRSRIAVTHTFLHIMEIFDFDNFTGLFSNPITTTNFSDTTNGDPYGLEFSPNGNLLYLSMGGANATKNLYQYNLLASSDTAIFNSRVSISDNWFQSSGSIQLGPDNRIYRTYGSSNDSIGVVESPNNVGLGCNYKRNGFYLGGMGSRLGLPPLNRFSEPFEYTQLCFGDSALFNNMITSLDSLKWDFGDTLSGSNNISVLNSPSHYFTSSGNYSVTLVTYNGLTIDTFSVLIHIKPYEFIGLGTDTTMCQGELLTLTASPSNANFLWQDSSTDSTFVVSTAGTYWVESTHSICSTSDTITVNYTPLPIINLGNDTILCPSVEIVLNASTTGASYLWQDASTNATFSVTLLGTYWVTVTVNNCSITDSITVNYTTIPIVNLGNDTTLCQGDVLMLDANFPNATYLWKDNSTNPTFLVNQTGEYWAIISNTCGTTSDTINVNYFAPLSVSIAPFNPDTVCDNWAVIPLPIGSPLGGTYAGNGISGNTFDPLLGGIGTHDIIYTIIDSNSCVNNDTTVVTVKLCVGIDENENDLGILIYPNPNTGEFTIAKHKGFNQAVQVRILDGNSKLILDKTIPIDQQKIDIDITKFSNGIYYIQLIVEEDVFVKQILKR